MHGPFPACAAAIWLVYLTCIEVNSVCERDQLADGRLMLLCRFWPRWTAQGQRCRPSARWAAQTTSVILQSPEEIGPVWSDVWHALGHHGLPQHMPARGSMSL